jgi:hypothetical protein
MEEHAVQLLLNPAQQAEEAALDQACVALSIALLDHPLKRGLKAL